MAKYIFYHIYCCNTTYSIVSDQVKKILFSDLYEKIDTIYCFLSGELTFIEEIYDYITRCGKKFKIADVGIDDNTFERFTIHKIKNYVCASDKFLYIHSKGVTKISQAEFRNVDDWRTYMEYFLICKHEKCLELLDIYDTVGVNLSYSSGMHYSGNFWWCRGSYFLTLPDITEDQVKPEDDSKFMFTENYLCMRQPNACCLFTSSNYPHYSERYLPENYIDCADAVLKT